MPTAIRIWDVSGNKSKELIDIGGFKEAELEKWILSNPEILGEPLLIISQQGSKKGVGRFDLVGLDAESNIVVIELKRAMTAREAITQALDYASWLDNLTEGDVRTMADEFLGRPLEQEFKARFQKSLSQINPQSHRIVLVAAGLDDAAERIVNYLRTKSVNINALFFRFARLDGGQQILVRSVLLPESVDIPSTRAYRITPAEVLVVAEERGIGKIVEKLRSLSADEVGEEATRGFGGASFRYWRKGPDRKAHVVFGIAVASEKYDTPDGQVDVWIHTPFWSSMGGYGEKEIKNYLERRFAYTSRTFGCTIRLSKISEAELFLSSFSKFFTRKRSKAAKG